MGQRLIFMRENLLSLSKSTLVSLSSANPVQALASRKSPLRTAILFPNCMSFSGPSETVQSFRFTIPRCTRNAVWMSSVISARFLWLQSKQNRRNKNKRKMSCSLKEDLLRLDRLRAFWLFEICRLQPHNKKESIRFLMCTGEKYSKYVLFIWHSGALYHLLYHCLFQWLKSKKWNSFRFMTYSLIYSKGFLC